MFATNVKSYQLQLSGLPEDKGRIKAKRLLRVVQALIETAERATRLSATGEGKGRGSKPGWLNATVDFTITGLEKGSTVIGLEAPSFADTARNVFSQLDFWREQPSLDDTALDLAALAIEEAGTDSPEGNRFDSSVLEAILKFSRSGGTSGISYKLVPQGSARGKFTLNEDLCARVTEQIRNIPPPKAFIVTGMLDEIRHEGGRFRLLLEGNSYILGRLNTDFPDVEALRFLWGKPATVEGMVHFKVNGQPRLIEARKISPRLEGDHVFEQVPEVEQDIESFLRGPARAADPKNLAGAWPGDESIEELLAELD